VVTVAAGHLAGCKWKRSHRYLSGYWLGHYELSIQDCLVRELSPGDVVYDIGANTGFFTLLASRCVGPEGRVYAFEPLPENVRSLGRQLQLNNVTNCTIVEAAVADRTGCVELAEGKDTNTAHLRAVRPHRSGGAVMSVKAIALDDFTRDRPKPDFIKMDVEGAEILALNGAAELLRARPPRMLIECHGEPLKRDACDLLQTCGYQVRLPDAGEADAETQGRHLLCVPDDLRA
jgi:FkbM family methyltransferase